MTLKGSSLHKESNMASLEQNIARLNNALERLINGKPERVNQKGILTLNRINKEAGFSTSYIHHEKFSDWVTDFGNPAIKTFNAEYDPLKFELEGTAENLSEVEKLKEELKKQRRLKDEYRQARDDAILSKKEVEKLANDLMFRVYELQEEKHDNNVTNLDRNKP